MDKYDKSLNTLINPNVILHYMKTTKTVYGSEACVVYFVLMKNYETFNIYIYPIIKIFFDTKKYYYPNLPSRRDFMARTQDGLVEYFTKQKRTNHFSSLDGLPSNKI